MDRAAGAVGVDGARVRPRRPLGVAHRVAVARRPRVGEERPVGRLRRRRKPPLEVVQQDRRAALAHREGIPPHAQRQPEPEVRRRDRVRALAREEGRRRGDADHDRVERLVEREPLRGVPADDRLDVGHRRGAAEHGRRRQLAGHPVDQLGAQAGGQQPEAAPQPGAGDPLELLLVVGIAAEDPRQVQREARRRSPARGSAAAARARRRAASPASRSSRAARPRRPPAAPPARPRAAARPGRRAGPSRPRSPSRRGRSRRAPG